MKFKNILLTLILITNLNTSLNAAEKELAQNATQTVLERVRNSNTKWRGPNRWKKAIQKPGAKVETVSKDGKHTITHEDGKIKVVSTLKDTRDISTPIWPFGSQFNSKDISDDFTKCNYKSLKIRRSFVTTILIDNPNCLEALMEIECTSTFDLESFLAAIATKSEDNK